MGSSRAARYGEIGTWWLLPRHAIPTANHPPLPSTSSPTGDADHGRGLRRARRDQEVASSPRRGPDGVTAADHAPPVADGQSELGGATGEAGRRRVGTHEINEPLGGALEGGRSEAEGRGRVVRGSMRLGWHTQQGQGSAEPQAPGRRRGHANTRIAQRRRGHGRYGRYTQAQRDTRGQPWCGSWEPRHLNHRQPQFPSTTPNHAQ
mmetsp:Transcript_45691/g.126671  ORF Transcript_45691/g.126671 Transcript_45691/m.126671 type:complete len:206 (+) Transcript_45691:186-803(+)